MPKDIWLVKNSPLTFSHNSESLAILNQKKRLTYVILILSIIAKEKPDWIAKSEKLLWFLTTLIAFVTAYIISMMWTGFLIANTCVHKLCVYLKRDQKNYIRVIIKWMNEFCFTVIVLNLKFLTIDFNKQK